MTDTHLEKHKWQTMKTAPRNGTEIYLRFGLVGGDVILPAAYIRGKWESPYPVPKPPKAWAELDEIGLQTAAARYWISRLLEK